MKPGSWCDRCHRPKHPGKCVGAARDPDLRADLTLERIREDRKKPPLFDLAGAGHVWLCDHCGAHGPANFGPDDTAFGAIEQIRKAHAERSPDCKGGKDYRIQVVNLERLKAKGRVA